MFNFFFTFSLPLLLLLLLLSCFHQAEAGNIYQAILGGFCQGDNSTLQAYQLIVVDKDLFVTLKLLPNSFFLPDDQVTVTVTAIGYWLEKVNTTTQVYQGTACTKESPCPAKCLEFAFKYTFGKLSSWFIGEGFLFSLKIRKNGQEDMLCKNFRLVPKSYINYPPGPEMFACSSEDISKGFMINGKKLEMTF